MRLPLLALGLVALGLACFGGACANASSSDSGADAGDLDDIGDDGDDGGAGESPSTGGDPDQGAGATGTACSLASDGISFSTTGCTNAMQTYCCNETQACFYNNNDCTTLHTCVLKCAAGGTTTTTTDAGTTAASDAGKSDSGTSGTADSGTSPLTACKNACYAQYPSQAAVEQAYNACYVKSTLGACN